MKWRPKTVEELEESLRELHSQPHKISDYANVTAQDAALRKALYEAQLRRAMGLSDSDPLPLQIPEPRPDPAPTLPEPMPPIGPQPAPTLPEPMPDPSPALSTPGNWTSCLPAVILTLIAGFLGLMEFFDDDDSGRAPITQIVEAPPAPSDADVIPPVAPDASVPSASDAVPDSALAPVAEPVADTVPIAGIPGLYVITEDVSLFSPGVSDPGDALGCAARRVPAEIIVMRLGPGQIELVYVDVPGDEAYAHVGTLDGQNRFAVDYPDVSGRQIQGRFEIDGSEVHLRDGRIYTGDCTFAFNGEQRH